MNNVVDLQEYLSFARSLVIAAERPIIQSYRNCVVSIKSDGSEVTEADCGAEQIIRELIHRSYPTHDVLGEEFGGVWGTGSEFQWILDPIDGTSSFVLGLPTFGTLVGLLVDGEPVLGLINFPAIGEKVYAARGMGCWFELRNTTPRQLHVSKPVDIQDANLSVSGIHNSDLANHKGPFALTSLIRQTKTLRFISDCVQHALVCKGALHAAIDTKLHPWDIAALIPCVEEAGGIASSLSGRRDGIVFGESLLTSCNRVLHNHIIDLLSQAPDGNVR